MAYVVFSVLALLEYCKCAEDVWAHELGTSSKLENYNLNNNFLLLCQNSSRVLDGFEYNKLDANRK